MCRSKFFGFLNCGTPTKQRLLHGIRSTQNIYGPLAELLTWSNSEAAPGTPQSAEADDQKVRASSASRSRSTASCHPLARLPAVPSPERILERIPKSPRNQKGATRLVSCAAREPHDPGVHIMKRSL